MNQEQIDISMVPLTRRGLTKDEIKKLYNKSYYEKTKENNKYKDRAQKIDCIVCGGSFCYYNRSRHNITKKHLKMVERLKKIKNDYV